MAPSREQLARELREAFAGRALLYDALDRADGAVAIAAQRCPLQDAWRGAGIEPERVARLCRIAGRFDTGLFGATGVSFSAETWTPGREGCCRIRLAR